MNLFENVNVGKQKLQKEITLSSQMQQTKQHDLNLFVFFT